MPTVDDLLGSPIRQRTVDSLLGPAPKKEDEYVGPFSETIKDIKGQFHEGVTNVEQGFDAAAKAYQDPNFSAKQFGKGALQMVGGAGEAAGAIGGGTMQANVSDPLRRAAAEPGRSPQGAGVLNRLANVADVGGEFLTPTIGAGLVKGGMKAAPVIGRAITEAGRIEDAERGLNAAQKAAKDIQTMGATSKAVGRQAADLYAYAAQQGGTLKPAFTDRFIGEVQKLAPQTEKGKAFGESPATKAIDVISSFKGQPITLNEAQEIDERLGRLIDKEYGLKGLSGEGKDILDIQTKFRRMIADAGENDLEGGKAGFEALKNGRKAWAQSMKLRDLERIQTRADHSEQPVTAIRQGIKTILSNPARLRGYDKDEIAALEKAYKTGFLKDGLRIVGSRLVPMFAGAAGHLPGSIAGHIVSSGARSMMADVQAQKLNKAMQVIAGKAPMRLSGPSSLLEQTGQPKSLTDLVQ